MLVNFVNRLRDIAKVLGSLVDGLRDSASTIEKISNEVAQTDASFAMQLKSFSKESRLTVVSREAKKKQHARASSGLRDHYSELFTRMAALILKCYNSAIIVVTLT